MVEVECSQTLTDEEAKHLENYDSRLFGFIRWLDPIKGSVTTATNHRKLLKKGISHLVKQLEVEGKAVDPTVFLKLGHYHILQEEYAKAMSAYQRYFGLSEEYFKDAPFLYGLGIVYFHFNAYKWAIKAFQQLLYVDQSFTRANEVHLRLGLMFKSLNNFDASLKHFQLALLDSSPCSLSKVEIQFHIAHLFEMQAKYELAKEAYRAIIAAPGMPPRVQSVAWRQLGWMHHSHHELGEKTHRIQEAVHCLQRSLELDDSSGSSWYFLGRCYAQLDKIHDAFTAYRHAIDKAEANANTWCSIGVLYQQQSQPMDALQAYVCAVQLDNNHVAAWTDLGVLYETAGHFQDAMVCYTNALKACGAPNTGLETRMKVLHEKMASPVVPEINKNLPGLEEAWKLPIPAELTTRTVRLVQQARLNQHIVLQARSQFTVPPAQDGEIAKDELMPPPVTPSAATAISDITAETKDDLKMAMLDDPPTSDTLHGMKDPSGDVMLGAMTNPMLTDNPSSEATSSQATVVVSSSDLTASTHIVTSVSDTTKPMDETYWQDNSLSINNSNDPSEPMLKADDNLNQINNTVDGDTLDTPTTLSEDNFIGAASSLGADVITPTSLPLPLVSPVETAVSKDAPTSAITPNLDLQMGQENLLSPKITSPLVSPNRTIKSPQALLSNGYIVPKICLLADESAVPSIPPTPEAVPLDQLNPPTPSIHVADRREAMSPVLRNFCLDTRNPVTVLKGLCKALKLDLSLFTTRMLIDQNPEHSVEIRHQRQQKSDKNVDEEGNACWECRSSRSWMTVAKYAQYQASTYQDSLHSDESDGEKKEKKDEEKNGTANPANIKEEKFFGDPEPNVLNGNGVEHTNGNEKEEITTDLQPPKPKKKKKMKMIKFGTNVDLSDTKKWKPQLAELTKLPLFLKFVCGSNMLCHVGHNVLGMNTVQLYMKIPGSRTPGHQENNNFASVNINIGPGDCEWFCTDHKYWGVIHTLCEKYGIDYLSGSWWPILDELYEERVPVHRFVQKPGDVVWVNTGCVHWVQALGWCNNIAWNVGPLTAHQFKLAIERYEWNKLQDYKSIVPMINLSWNLARNIRIPDSQLAEHLKLCLQRSLTYCTRTFDILKEDNIEVIWHGHEKNEAAHYCSTCEVEVFNILFVKEMNRKLMVHCQDCARKTSHSLEGFIVLNQFSIDDLTKVFEAFCTNMTAKRGGGGGSSSGGGSVVKMIDGATTIVATTATTTTSQQLPTIPSTTTSVIKMPMTSDELATLLTTMPLTSQSEATTSTSNSPDAALLATVLSTTSQNSPSMLTTSIAAASPATLSIETIVPVTTSVVTTSIVTSSLETTSLVTTSVETTSIVTATTAVTTATVTTSETTAVAEVVDAPSEEAVPADQKT